LKALDTKQLFSPWEAGPLTLRAADIRLGETYPAPIVDHAAARARALDAFASIKGAPNDAKTPEQIVEKEAQAA
ncbi:MAG: FAD-binding domain-containing protein, partial [Pseudomonadota bacterium]|nr:FAD-binding domain-containing protein [Pseudomonadota bacterium]